ncbi:MAG: uroporphyrinogen decarboxylase family protein [Anaerolineales bacterium]
MAEISHHQRLETCLSGNETDRPPVSLWRHFPVDDQTPEGLAAAVVNFQKQYDFDFIKVTPASSFCIKDWGATDRWTGNFEGTRDYQQPVILHPEDWVKLPLLDPNMGHLGRQLTALRYLKNEFGNSVPILQTIFSPLAQAKNLVGKDNLILHIRQYPEALRSGLEIITESTIRFIDEAMKIGIDGVFFAIQHAQYSLLSQDEFLTFEKPYDIKVLETTKSLWLNMIHLHGEHVMFDLVADLPVQIINWHDRHTQPSLKEALDRFPGVVCGGLKRWETMVLGSPEDVLREAKDAIQQTSGRRFILGTGCVLPIITPHGNILAARRSIEI